MRFASCVPKRDKTSPCARAIALAMIYPEDGKRGRGNVAEASKYAESAGFSARRLQDARMILRAGRMLVEAVLAGRELFARSRSSGCPPK